jgi:hypothetical protein
MSDDKPYDMAAEAVLLAQCEVYSAWHGQLHFCGCGRPDEVLRFVRDVLLAHYRITWAARNHNPLNLPDSQKPEYDQARKEFDALLRHPPEADGKLAKDHVDYALYYMTLYTLDAAGMTEHGGSVSGGWLSYLGEHLLENMLKLTDEQLYASISSMGTGVGFSDNYEDRDWKCHGDVVRSAFQKFIKAAGVDYTAPSTLTDEERRVYEELKKA